MKDTTEEYYADTYALVEIAKGNQQYNRYAKATLLITQLNLMEFYYHLLQDTDKATADREFEICMNALVPITSECIKAAMLFKLEHKKEKLSYADCIGYAKAFELGIKFLTGDIKFQDKPNTEFVR